MPKRTRSHHDALLEYLQDPRAAAHYLNAALEDSDEMFLIALRNVAETQKMSKVAARAGVSRESVYRMLRESGNPTYASLTGILKALGLRIAVEADIVETGLRSQRDAFKTPVTEGALTNSPNIADLDASFFDYSGSPLTEPVVLGTRASIQPEDPRSSSTGFSYQFFADNPSRRSTTAYAR